MQFYQRMLSMESEDMLDLATKHIAEHSLEEFYEDVFVPALLLSEEDRHNGTLPEVRQRFIFEASRELIDELERRETLARETAEAADPEATATRTNQPALPAVLGIPARDEADEVVCYLLCHLLRRRGIGAATAPLTSPIEDVFKSADRAEVRTTFVSALPPSAVGAARQMCRRLKLRSPDTPVVVGVWQYRASLDELEERLRDSGPNELVTRLSDAVQQIEALLGVRRPAAKPGDAPPTVSAHSRPPLPDGTRSPLPRLP